MLHFSQTYPVRWKDIDSFGILNNAIYFTLMEEARFDYFKELDLMRGDQFPFVLGETSCRFEYSGRPGIQVRVATGVVSIGTKSLEMRYELYDQDTLLAQGAATLVWVDAERNSIPIPEDARQTMAQFDALQE